jgi:hypothetical protein
VVMKQVEGINYTNTAANTNGKVFIEDAPIPFKPQFSVNMWARQLNPEVQSEADKDLDNNGGKFWILGLKTEGRAVIANTTNCGSTEILGALILPASSFSTTTQPAFTVNNAHLSVAGLTMTSYINNGWYGYGFTETQNNETKSVLSSNIWSNTPYEIMFYRTKKVALAASLTKANACFKTSDILTVTAEGGTPPYTYSFSSGATAVAALPNTATIASIGNYTATVTDACGLSYTTSQVNVVPATVIETVNLANPIIGKNDGSIKLTMKAGGTTPYTFELTGNNSTVSNTTGNFMGLSAGTYSVVVTSANGCSATFTNIQLVPIADCNCR